MPTDSAPFTSGSRKYPARPIVGVAGLVLHQGRVLLIRRGRAPREGAWSLPGGALRTGERIVDGISREVFEETGLQVEPVRQIATLDRILRDDAGGVQFHYVLIDWLCRVVYKDSVPVAGGDALEAAWIEQADLSQMPGMEQLVLELIFQTIQEEGHSQR